MSAGRSLPVSNKRSRISDGPWVPYCAQRRDVRSLIPRSRAAATWVRSRRVRVSRYCAGVIAPCALSMPPRRMPSNVVCGDELRRDHALDFILRSNSDEPRYGRVVLPRSHFVIGLLDPERLNLKLPFFCPRGAPGLRPPCRRHRLRPRIAGRWHGCRWVFLHHTGGPEVCVTPYGSSGS
jgi:hypothetical protein